MAWPALNRESPGPVLPGNRASVSTAGYFDPIDKHHVLKTPSENRFEANKAPVPAMKVDWMPVTRFEQNCSILWCEKTARAAAIDPGGDIDRVLDFLEWENLTLDVVLVTHGHFDHCGAAKELAARAGARIEGPHRNEAHVLEGLAEHGARYGVRAQSFVPDRWLQDGDRIGFGEVEIAALHCPGHTRGHMAYFHAPTKSLLSAISCSGARSEPGNIATAILPSWCTPFEKSCFP